MDSLVSALGTQTGTCPGHGCLEQIYALGMDALVTVYMLLERERGYAFGMDALVTVCFGSSTLPI